MKSNYYFSVEDILSRSHFEHAKVVAGFNGKQRQVKWVHVVEVPYIKNLLNGNELILTTGLALKEEDKFLSLIKQLIECEASALCIELETNITKIPSAVLGFAEENDFPIVVFEKEVPFVSITQDIHSVLINQQYDMIKKLDHYAQELNKKLLNVNHYREILQVLHKELSVPVVFQLKEHEVEVFPKMRRSEEDQILLSYKADKSCDTHHFASAKVILFNREYADLFIYRNDFPFSEYELLLLDRTSTALAQYLMRELYFNEKKRMDESKWIMSWVKGEQRLDSLESYLSDIKADITGGVVCIGEMKIKEEDSLNLTYFNLVIRSIFEQQGFQVMTEEDGGRLILILLDTRINSTWKSRASKAFEKILDSDILLKSSDAFFSVGKYEEKLENMHKSCRTAEESLIYLSSARESRGFYFSEDLHLYRLISMVNKSVNLTDMIEEYLYPLMKYDSDHDGSLLHTLRVFLNCQGSKQETAKRLFIVRQTLYHRLKKIEELLGEDFMDSEKRVAIEFLLCAHEYLQPVKAREQMKIR